MNGDYIDKKLCGEHRDEDCWNVSAMAEEAKDCYVTEQRLKLVDKLKAMIASGYFSIKNKCLIVPDKNKALFLETTGLGVIKALVYTDYIMIEDEALEFALDIDIYDLSE